MHIREISKFISNYLFVLAAFLLIPLSIALYYQFFVPKYLHPQPHSTLAFIYTILICLVLAFILRYVGRKADGRKLFRRESFLSLCLIWFLSGIIGGIPFILSGTLSNPIDAYFEAVSGFTTTGASVMYPKNIDPVTGENKPINVFFSEASKVKYSFYGNISPIKDPTTGQVLYTGFDAIGTGLLFWRSFMQWLGGMGIVVLFIAVLPAYGLGGNKLLVQAEIPGPSKESLAPRAKEAASLLWKAYLALTIILIFLLKASSSDLTLLDSVLISMATISTGGFMPYRETLQIYNAPLIQWIMMLFMLIGSTNFTLIFYVIRGKLFKLLDPEFLLYVLTILIGSSFVIFNLVGKHEMMLSGITEKLNLTQSFRLGLFQYISCQSSTGFMLVDYDQWPYFAQAIMITAMYLGGMSCSTAGGIKVLRYYILMRAAIFRTESIFKPEIVSTFKIRQQPVNPTIKETTLSFFFLVIFFSLLSTLIYIADGLDFRTAFSVTSSFINNVGLAYGPGGASQSFAYMSNFSKLASTFWMVLGRLEFYMLLILFTPAFWKKA